MFPPDSPSELAQSCVAVSEVMTHLVNDRPPYLLGDISLAGDTAQVARRKIVIPSGKAPA